MKLCWQQIPSPVISEILCNTGLDGVVLDTEHASFNDETLYSCIQVVTLSGKSCFVRLIEPTKKSIRLCLDAGATGLIFSTIENVKQCQDVMNHSRFPDAGGRRGLGLVRQNLWGKKRLVSDSPLLIAQIETVKGVNNIDDISKYGFDYYMIGPYDLSASLGSPGDFDCEKFKLTIKRVQEKIPLNKMAVHIPTDVKKELKKYNNYGIIAMGMDTISLFEFYKELV